MKVLLTGSSGFLGKEVLKVLCKNKHTVIEFDISNGKNILNQEQIETEMKKASCCIHLAGIVENENPALWKINVEGTKNIAHAAEKTKLKKLIFMSTTGVYGFTTREVNEKTPVTPENT
ncbi:MAG: NAD(P)-dependent oxidoreductase, partial [archaeon]